MSRTPIDADAIMTLLAQHDSVGVWVHSVAVQHMIQLFGPRDDVGLVLVLRGNDKTPASLREPLGLATRGIIIRDAAAHFGLDIGNKAATLISGVLDLALDQVPWPDVGDRVYRRARASILADASLAESADRRMTDAAVIPGSTQ
jgi:hypothetical protein